jgi:hypothetical protein
MRLVDFVFGGESSISVVMRKPLGVEGTLFSFDTKSILNSELALSFESQGSIWVYNAGEKAEFPMIQLDSDNWIILGFTWSWSDGDMSYKLTIGES